MRKITQTQTDSATWGADSTIATDLERVGLLTRIDATVELTPSATLSGANQIDGLWRLIRNMRIVGGAHTYVNLPADDGAMAGVLLHYLNTNDGFGPGHEAGDVAAPSESYVPVNFVFHMGSRPLDKYGRDNPYDLSAFVPANAESQLRAEWSVSGNDVMDDTVTISSAVMNFTLHRLLGTEQEMLEEMARQEVVLPAGAKGMVPAWSALVHGNAAATTDFNAEQVDIVVGSFLKRIATLNQDATANRPIRASDQVTEMEISVPKTTEALYRAKVEYALSLFPAGTNLTADDAGPNFGAHVAEGIHVIDLRSRASSLVGREYGLDLRGQESGTFKLGLLISNRAVGDGTLILFERYQPYNGDLAA